MDASKMIIKSPDLISKNSTADRRRLSSGTRHPAQAESEGGIPLFLKAEKTLDPAHNRARSYGWLSLFFLPKSAEEPVPIELWGVLSVRSYVSSVHVEGW
jgi:hypothetical protein